MADKSSNSELTSSRINPHSLRWCPINVVKAYQHPLDVWRGFLYIDIYIYIYIYIYDKRWGGGGGGVWFRATPKIYLWKEGNYLFNDAPNTFYLRLYGIRHMVKDHSDSERGNPLLPERVLLYASSQREDNTYHGLCYTSRGALAGMIYLWLQILYSNLQILGTKCSYVADCFLMV